MADLAAPTALIPTALTIAGSDPSGGAGIQGDLKTFFAHGVHGMAVLAALTAQNVRGVFGVHDVPPDFVVAQLKAALDDRPVSAIKTGMLSVPLTIDAVASVLERRPPAHLVVDPVMVATSGAPLLRDDAVRILVERIFPLASVITPNLPEAERLLGQPVDDPMAAARALLQLGPKAVLLKGGHGTGDTVLDVLVGDGVEQRWVEPRIDTDQTHGTGCALAAGLAARLAHGDSLPDAVTAARAFVRRGLEHAAHGAVNHLAMSGGLAMRTRP